MKLEQLKYPIGKYETPSEITSQHISTWIATIEQFPEQLNMLLIQPSKEELNYQYRPDGWTVKQVVHHLADSHLNSFTRFKLMLTEDNPTIKPYNEADWAETADANNDHIALSLNMLVGLHSRWAILLKSLESNDFDRTYFHPEDKKQYTLKWMLGLYNWHCQHHLAHIEQALKLEGDFTQENLDSLFS